jgi:hypothetical protein
MQTFLLRFGKDQTGLTATVLLALTLLGNPAFSKAEAEQPLSDGKAFHIVFYEKGGKLDLSLSDETLTIAGGPYLNLRCGLNRAVSAQDQVKAVDIMSTCSFSRRGDTYTVDANSLLRSDDSYYDITFTTEFSVTNDKCKVLSETSSTTGSHLGKPVNRSLHTNTWPCSVQ